MLNADVKFNRFILNYGLGVLYPEMQLVVQETIDIVDLDFQVPGVTPILGQPRTVFFTPALGEVS